MDIDIIAKTGTEHRELEVSKFTDDDGSVMHRLTFSADLDICVGRDLRDVLHVLEAAAREDEAVAALIKARLSI